METQPPKDLGWVSGCLIKLLIKLRKKVLSLGSTAIKNRVSTSDRVLKLPWREPEILHSQLR
jgi:hypothetical protein